MVDRVADHFGRVHVRVYRVRGKFARGAHRRERYRPHLRNRGLRLHDFRRLVGRAKKSGHLASGPCPSLATGTSVAGPAQPPDDFFPRWFSVRRRPDESVDDFADYGGGERPVWGRVTTLHAPPDDV